MPSSRLAHRASCCARNAYNPAFALRSAFGTTIRLYQQEKEELKEVQGDGDRHGGIDTINARRRTCNRKDHVRVKTTDALVRRVSQPLPSTASRTSGQVDGLTYKNANQEDNDSRRREQGGLIRKVDEPLNSTPSETPGQVARNADKNAHEEDDGSGRKAKDSLRWREHMTSLRNQYKDELPETMSETRRAELKALCDYEPLFIRTQPTPPPGHPKSPFVLRDNDATRKMSSHQILEEEIRRFSEYIQPTLAEKAARKAVIDDTIAAVRRQLPEGNTLELFGSSLNGLALPHSDIDLRIFRLEHQDMPPRFFLRRLRKIADCFRKDRRFELVTVRGTNFPSLNCLHVASGLSIQIVAGFDAQPQVDVVKALCDEIPNLKSLFWVFRVALDMRGLIELYYGGIGSYGLFNMIAAALSRGPIKHAPLTAQMLHVLDFYGCDFDMTRRGLAVTAECTPPSRQFFLKHSLPAADLHSYADLARLRNDPIRAGRWQICRKSEFMPYLLCLQDPVDPTNDLGKKSYAIKHIVRSIEGMRNQLYKAMSQREDALRKGEQPMSTPYLKRIVGVCQSVYWKRRKRLEDVGNGVLKGKTLDQIAREKRAAWEKGTFGSATTIHKEADDVDGEARQTGLQENGNEARTEVYEAEGEEMEEVEKIEKIPKPVFEETYGW